MKLFNKKPSNNNQNKHDEIWKPSIGKRINNWFHNLTKGFRALDVHKKLAWIQLFLYVVLFILDIIIRVVDKTANADTSLIALIRFTSATDTITLIIRLVTMVLAVVQIVYGIRDKFTLVIIAGAAALLQTLPIGYIPFFAAIVALSLNIMILASRY